MKTQFSPAVGQPVFAGKTQKKSLMGKIGGALAGAAMLGGAAMSPALAADAFTPSKPVAGITKVQAAPAQEEETLGQLGKELGDSFIGAMEVIAGLARQHNVTGVERLDAAIAASKEAGKGLEGIDLSKELDREGMIALQLYVNTVMEQSGVFDEVIAENPKFAETLQTIAQDPDSDLAKAGERLGRILEKIFG